MQTTSALRIANSETPRVEEDRHGGGACSILFGVFETLDRAGISYCVLHGYEAYSQQIKSDVDCIIDANMTPRRLFALLKDNSARIGADVVRCRGLYVVLAGRNADGSRCFLTLDLSVNCEVDGLHFYLGSEILESRRRCGQFWIPAAHLEFGSYLVRSIAKGRLDKERVRRLSRAYQEDPAGSDQQVTRFWGPRSGKLILSAAHSGDWSEVRQRLSSLRSEIRRRAILRVPGRFATNLLHGVVARFSRVWRVDGVNVVLLGPDGAGKSSVIEALPEHLAPTFSRYICWGFPALLQNLRRRTSPRTDQPHALPARSLFISLVRAGFWFVYHTFGYVKLRLALARSTLVLNDRHFVDILVDSKRYRYGGPLWLMSLIWRLIPKPDLIILLDAPPKVLQARKQEVSYEETVRQRTAYLSLAQSIGNGHIVDASKSLEHVTDDVSDVILRHLAVRTARRFELNQNVSLAARPADRGGERLNIQNPAA